jgi:pyruvate dehydrogenase E1 component beta subunit
VLFRSLASPDLPTPAGYTLEDAYYFGKEEIKQAILEVAR